MKDKFVLVLECHNMNTYGKEEARSHSFTSILGCCLKVGHLIHGGSLRFAFEDKIRYYKNIQASISLILNTLLLNFVAACIEVRWKYDLLQYREYLGA
jgi:hypothetical protein